MPEITFFDPLFIAEYPPQSILLIIPRDRTGLSGNPSRSQIGDWDPKNLLFIHSELNFMFRFGIDVPTPEEIEANPFVGLLGKEWK